MAALKDKVKEMLRDLDDGVALANSTSYTVSDIVQDWLAYGLTGVSKATVSRSVVGSCEICRRRM